MGIGNLFRKPGYDAPAVDLSGDTPSKTVIQVVIDGKLIEISRRAYNLSLYAIAADSLTIDDTDYLAKVVKEYHKKYPHAIKHLEITSNFIDRFVDDK